ncbi:FAD-dependent oxidoreductase [Spirillospora sp. NPDC047418]
MNPEQDQALENATADLVVIGSGAAGLSAAVRAAALGLDVLVVEKGEFLGGTAAMSGGAIWLPDNPLIKEAGADDSFERSMTYLDACVGEPGPAASRARKEAYVREGPRLVDFLRGQGLTFSYSDGYPDYYPELPGGHVRGRSIMAEIFDRRRLGEWDAWMRRDVGFKMQILIKDAREIMDVPYVVTTGAGRRALAAVAGRTVLGRLRRQRKVSLGQALVGQLLLAAQRLGVRVWREAPLTGLMVADGAVTGATVARGGADVAVRARHGVLLAAGGFARNAGMRREYGPHPSSADWTSVSVHDTGDAIRAAMEIGAATDLMDEATWSPTTLLPDGTPSAPLWERMTPFSIMVDARGERFCNEAGSYMEIGQRMYERGAVPSWIVFDARHRNRYPFGDAMPRMTPKEWLTSGYLKKAGTVQELARACGIDADGLARTVERFNRMADAGVDADFARGASEVDRAGGDRSHKPNPCLGALEKAPFYAIELYPGDAGTCGGLLTDAHARVLARNGAPIGGLYAAGATSASVMGRVYPGGGCSLGPALVFGFVAADHVAGAAGRARAATGGEGAGLAG